MISSTTKNHNRNFPSCQLSLKVEGKAHLEYNSFHITMENNQIKNREYLLKLAKARMPFGKYKNKRLIDLPEPYVVWFSQKGFPKGELGEMMQIIYEIKVNGLEYLFKPLSAKKVK
jgi:uncharacterized protein